MTVTTPPLVDMDFFEENGYLVIENVYSDTEIANVVDEYMELLDRLAEGWVAEGQLQSTYAELPFPQRRARILSETGGNFQPFDISLPSRGVTAETPVHNGPAVFELLTSPRLLDIVEHFVGQEVLSNPIQHVRIKPPEHLLPADIDNSMMKSSAWHQDQGVALPEVDNTEMLTVWIAVTDATLENSCLWVVPSSHRGDLITHCPGNAARSTLAIPESLVPDTAIPLPVAAGSIIVLHRRTMHSALANTSDGVRWSFDCRFQPVGQPTGRAEYPAFVARSASDPDSVLTDWQEWKRLWEQARADVAASPNENRVFNRWDGSHEVCA